MITPSKFVPIEESILFKSTYLLEELMGDIEITELYELTKDKFDSIEDFILSIDLLYIMNKVQVNLETGIISHA